MYEFLIYNIKVGACLTVFYLFFKLFLAKETFHRFNRATVLTGIIVSFLLPVFHVTFTHVVPMVTEPLNETISIQTATETTGNYTFIIKQIIGLIYIMGLISATSWLLMSYYKVYGIIRKGEKKTSQIGITVLSHENISPFSFGRYIVIPDHKSKEENNMILLHEQAHVRLLHTVDLVATDLLGMLQWFNPFFWMLRKELKNIHEYEADEQVLKQGTDPKDYQILLIKNTVGERWYSVANSFNHNKVKIRITMMLKKKSSKMAKAKVLIAIPLLSIAVVSFAENRYVTATHKVNENVSHGTIKTDSTETTCLIDGIKVSPESILNLSPDKIASVTVLKNQDSIAKYSHKTGDRGKAILVKTKTAKSKKRNLLTKTSPKVQKADEAATDNLSNVLITVDNEPATETHIKELSPENIQSITILKGSSAKDFLQKHNIITDKTEVIRIITKNADNDSVIKSDNKSQKDTIVSPPHKRTVTVIGGREIIAVIGGRETYFIDKDTEERIPFENVNPSQIKSIRLALND